MGGGGHVFIFQSRRLALVDENVQLATRTWARLRLLAQNLGFLLRQKANVTITCNDSTTLNNPRAAAGPGEALAEFGFYSVTNAEQRWGTVGGFAFTT